VLATEYVDLLEIIFDTTNVEERQDSTRVTIEGVPIDLKLLYHNEFLCARLWRIRGKNGPST